MTVPAPLGLSQDGTRPTLPINPDTYHAWTRTAGRVDVNPAFLTGLGVSAGACVWSVLLSRFEQDGRLCVWGVESSARRLGIAPRTAWRHNDQVERAGWLKITRRRSDTGNPGWRSANPSELVIEKTAIRSFRKILATPGQSYAPCSLAPLGTDQESMILLSFHAIRAWWIAGWMRRTSDRVTAATLAARLPTVGGRAYCSPERARAVLRELAAAGLLVWDETLGSYVEPESEPEPIARTQDSDPGTGSLNMAGSPLVNMAGSPLPNMAGRGTPLTPGNSSHISPVQSPGSREAAIVTSGDARVDGAAAPEPPKENQPNRAKRHQVPPRPRLRTEDRRTLAAALTSLTTGLSQVRAGYAVTLAAACMHAEQVTAGQIAWRIIHNRADTLDKVGPITDPIAWLSKFGLDRRGCSNPDCQDGHLYQLDAPCLACREYRIERGRTAVPTPSISSPVADNEHQEVSEPVATELPTVVMEALGRIESGQADATEDRTATLRAAIRRRLKTTKHDSYVVPEGDEQ